MADEQQILGLIEGLRDQQLELANIVKGLADQVQRIDEQLQKLIEQPQFQQPPQLIPPK